MTDTAALTWQTHGWKARSRTFLTPLVAPVFVFSIFVNLLMLTGPLFMLQVYDRVLGSRSEETLVALFVLVGILYVLMGLLDYARGRLMARVAARYRALVDGPAFEHLLRTSLDPRTRTDAAKGMRHAGSVQSLLTSPTILALFDVPWTPVFLIAIFIFHPLLGWLAVFGGGVLIVVALLNNMLTVRKTAEAQERAHCAHSLAEQAHIANEIVRSQGMSRAIESRWLAAQSGALKHALGASDWTGGFSAFTKAFRLFLQSAMLALGAWLVLGGQMTAGAMIAGSILMGRALAPLEQVIAQWALVQRAIAGWTGMRQILEEAPDHDETTVLPPPAAALSVKNVTVFAPGAAAAVLNAVSFDVAPGQVVGIIGQSGTGKSTLARTLVGVMIPRGGEVRLGGATLAQYDPDQLGRLIGYLPQNVTLFSGTVAENIARMSIAPDEAAIFAAAKRANAHEMILALPDGYQTMLHGSGSQLSGGQKQRIALARALYGDPIMLVLDEPNSALDNLGTEALNRTIREFRSLERSVILMTHRPQAIAECDRLVVLDGGRIKAHGPRDEVLQALVTNAAQIQQVVGGKAAS